MSRLDPYTLPDGSFDYERIYAEMMQFGRDADRLNAAMRSLTRRYPMQWAAMQNGELTIAPTHQDLMAKLDYENKRNAAVRHLNPRPPRVVLMAASHTLH